MSPLSPGTGAPAATDEAAFSPPRTGHAPAAPKVARTAPRTAPRTAQPPASARTGGALANDEVSA